MMKLAKKETASCFSIKRHRGLKSRSGSSASRPQPSQTVDGFIEAQARGMTAARLKELALFSAEMMAKLRSPQAVMRLEFQQQAQLVLKILHSQEVRFSYNPLPPHLAELAVAAHYLLKGVDLIPDHIPEIGLADDEIILRRVFARNPEWNQLLKH